MEQSELTAGSEEAEESGFWNGLFGKPGGAADAAMEERLRPVRA